MMRLFTMFRYNYIVEINNQKIYLNDRPETMEEAEVGAETSVHVVPRLFVKCPYEVLAAVLLGSSHM